jgi:hypothetical protein
MSDPTRCRSTLVLAVLLFTVVPVLGQEPPLVADRPDFTDSPVLVPPGSWQLEGGVGFASDDESDAESWSVGQLLLRVGVHERVELRIDAGSWVYVELPGDDADGFADPGLGAKVLLYRGAGARQEQLALIAGTSVPLDDEPIGEDEWQPSATLSLGWSLSERWSMTTNLGATRASAGGDRFNQIALSGSLGGTINERLSGFVEVYGLSEESPEGDETAYADAGLLYLLRPRLQLDVSLGFGLVDEAADWFVNLGATRKW